MSDEQVSRGEFTMLANTVSENQRRLDMIDQSGTRGVGVLQVQITDLAKDIARLDLRLDGHEHEHEVERKERSSARWKLAALVVALFAAIEGPLITLLLTHPG